MPTTVTSSDRFDLLVVGGGAFGLGTATEAARRGRRVAGIERGPLPNPVAASYGPSRKIRSTYTEPHYAMLAREAMTAWRQVEGETGGELYRAVGTLGGPAASRTCGSGTWRTRRWTASRTWTTWKRSAGRSAPTSSCWTGATCGRAS